MKKLNILLLLILSLGSNAKNLNSQNLTGTNYYLVNQNDVIVAGFGNTMTGIIPAQDVILSAGLYRFKGVGSSSGIFYFGGVGFPTGSTSSATNFINVSAGTYDISLIGNNYVFTVVTFAPWKIEIGYSGLFRRFNDMGDGSYCLSNLIFSSIYMSSNEIRFRHTDNAGTITRFTIASFPMGQLAPSNAYFSVPLGTYNVCLDSNNMSYSFTNTLGVEEVNLEKASIYPNPTENEWNFKLKNNSKNTIEIYNCLGKKVNEYTFIGETFSINSTTLSSGIYFAHILSDNDLTVVKLIKK